MQSTDRVRAQTAAEINLEIDAKTKNRLARAACAPSAVLGRLIADLDEEWDIERWLETNASALALGGTLLGLLVNRNFSCCLACFCPFSSSTPFRVGCPPLPLFRRKGIRTRREIEVEKHALKALRGDFAGIERNGDPAADARAAWRAAST